MGPNKTSKADKARYIKLKQLGCICCRKRGAVMSTQVHHLVEGRKRLGNDATIPLCDYHHMGYRYSKFAAPGSHYGREDAVRLMGPSLADSKSRFIEEFGTERELLAEVNELLEAGGDWPFAQEVYG